MRTFRAYLSLNYIELLGNYQLSLSESHHISKVLRSKEGDLIEIFNGKGQRFTARIENIGKTVTIRVMEEKTSHTASPLFIHLMISIGKGDKMDWVVQKATELGVSKITPLISARCEVRLPKERMHKKVEHWREIAIQACVQSRQDTIPEITEAFDFSQALSQEEQGAKYLFHPSEKSVRFKTILEQASPGHSVVLLVGSEGGFDAKEVSFAIERGFRLASLGPRILRMETAAVASLALVQGIIGDL